MGAFKAYWTHSPNLISYAEEATLKIIIYFRIRMLELEVN